jgi:hypothetical protein
MLKIDRPCKCYLTRVKTCWDELLVFLNSLGHPLQKDLAQSKAITLLEKNKGKKKGCPLHYIPVSSHRSQPTFWKKNKHCWGSQGKPA